MKNFTRLLAIIALTAVIGFTMMGCDDGKGGLSNLKGDITIISMGTKVTTATTGTELTAAYSGTETISYQWYKDGVAIDSETNATYTPIEAGTYTVKISAAGYNPKTSAAVTVDGPTLSILSGTISITTDSDVVVGAELKAVYTGDETVTYTYQWYKDGVAIPDETNETYIPTEVGSYAVRVSADGYVGKTSAAVVVGYPPPVADDFEFSNMSQTIGNIGPVMITPKADKSTGTITIYYDGSTDLPTTAGTYTVTFDVAGVTGWSAVTGLEAGTLTISDNFYIINGSGTTFTATKSGATLGTADRPIQTVIDAIRVDADGDEVGIQFGDNVTPLDIGTASVQFNTTNGAWGEIILSGGITSTHAVASEGTIMIGADVTVNSTANIANTEGTFNGRAIQLSGTGTLTINGGTVSATGVGIAIYLGGTGTLTISGGTVSAVSGRAIYGAGGTITVSGTAVVTSSEYASLNSDGTIFLGNSTSLIITGGTVSRTAENTLAYAIYNYGTGAITISGGIVSAKTGSAIYNAYNGLITVSGTAVVTSEVSPPNSPADRQGTIYLANGYTSYTATRLKITGGTVQNTADNTGNTSPGKAVSNDSAGAIEISGGKVSADTGVAVYSRSAGVITISDNALITSANRNVTSGNYVSGGTIFLDDNSGTATATRLKITGGTVQNTFEGGSGTNSRTIYNESTGAIEISGGTVSIKAGTAIESGDIAASSSSTGAGTGTITISGDAIVTSASGIAIRRFIVTSDSTGGTLNITGGTVSSTGGNTVEHSGGTMNVSGGTISGGTETTTYTVFNDGGTIPALLNITGGTILATSGVAVYNNGTFYNNGTVNISGGTVSATTGRAVFCGRGTSNLSISGNAIVTSANTNTASGTVQIAESGGSGTVTFEITGGTISNTSTGNAVYLYYGSSYSILTLGGSPTITGPIYRNDATAILNLTGTPTFNPGSKQYTLAYNAVPAVNTVAVTGGSGFQSNFILASNLTTRRLEISGSDLVLVANP